METGAAPQSRNFENFVNILGAPFFRIGWYKIEYPGRGTELVTVLDSDEPRFSGKGAANAEFKNEKYQYNELGNKLERSREHFSLL